VRRSDGAGANIHITDNIKCNGQHYGVAVDIYDHKTYSILWSLLDTLNRFDTVTLIGFGDHIESVNFGMGDHNAVCGHVRSIIERRESGCNIAMALAEMDRATCDTRILISSGGFNDGPQEIKLIHPIIRISPASPRYPKTNAGDKELSKFAADLILKHECRQSQRMQIRNLLNKPLPNFYNIKLELSGVTHYIKPIAYGGTHSVCVPPTTHGNQGITLTYFDKEGNIIN
jgi:hypothetical protein